MTDRGEVREAAATSPDWTALDALPVMLTVEENIEYFSERGEPTPDELFGACLRVGRIPAVALLVDLYFEGLLTPEAAAARVGDVWSSSEYPDRHLDHDAWRRLFALAGYTEDGKRATRPADALTLWRGSVPERRSDWSWTDNREVAERYAGGKHYSRPPSTVWQARVDPWRLLARNTQRAEHEYVVDTEGLTITTA